MQDYKRYDHSILRLKNNQNEIIHKTYFYYFTKSEKSPEYYTTKDQWQQVLYNFKILRCPNTNLQPRMNTKRRELMLNTDLDLYSDDENSTSNIITPPNFRRRLTIVDVIGDYNTSPEGRIIFNCKKNETVYDCLSRRIDQFNLIMNNKKCISTIVNKAREAHCEINSHQTILIINRMQYLKQAYLFMLEKQSSGSNNTFSNCCKKTIEYMSKCNGVNVIRNHEILMKWNRVFRLDEVFPHPNVNIQMGNTYQSELLEAFPEVKTMIQKWANNNLDKLNCENVGLYIRNDVVPKIYKTYLSEEENDDEHYHSMNSCDYLN